MMEALAVAAVPRIIEVAQELVEDSPAEQDKVVTLLVVVAVPTTLEQISLTPLEFALVMV